MASDLTMQVTEVEPSTPSGRLREHGDAAAATFVTAGAELGADGGLRCGSRTTMCADEALGILCRSSYGINGYVRYSHRVLTVAYFTRLQLLQAAALPLG
jgi:hypothetical protein